LKGLNDMFVKKILTMVVLLCASYTPTLYAQWRPTETVKAVIPFAPGGGADIAFKHFQKWAEERNVKIVPIYKGGAEGLIGMDYFAKSPPDGMTISFGTIATSAVYLKNNPNYNFNYVSMIRGSVMSVVTHQNSNINNINDLEKQLQNNESKKSFAYGSPAQKLLLEQIFKNNKLKSEPLMVAYKGAGPMVQDLIGGHVDVSIVPMSVVKPHIDSEKLKVIAISSRNPWSEINKYAVLNKRYSSWQNFDGFLVSLPASVNQDTLSFWINLIQSYLSDPNVTQDFQKEYTETLPFGPKSAHEAVEQIRKM